MSEAEQDHIVLSRDERETIRTAGNPATLWEAPESLYRAVAKVVAGRVLPPVSEEWGESDRRVVGDKDRMRGTGGNRFIEADSSAGDLLASINDQLGDLREWASWSGRVLDLAEVTISTRRIANGRISVSVTADLAAAPELTSRPGVTTAEEDA